MGEIHMLSTQSTHSTLAQHVVGEKYDLLAKAMLVIGGSLALWVSAKIHIPFYPVPMTMQTFAVLVIGMAFGWRLGGATVLLYLAEGASGLPVFSGAPEREIGLAYMAGPTGGYLAGFLISAVVVGWLAERGWDRNLLTTSVAMLIGTVIIFLPGVFWLGTLIGWDEPVVALGVTQFIYAEILKIALAAAVLPLAWKALGRATGT